MERATTSFRFPFSGEALADLPQSLPKKYAPTDSAITVTIGASSVALGLNDPQMMPIRMICPRVAQRAAEK